MRRFPGIDLALYLLLLPAALAAEFVVRAVEAAVLLPFEVLDEIYLQRRRR